LKQIRVDKDGQNSMNLKENGIGAILCPMMVPDSKRIENHSI
jgi:hypothetical protein